MPLTLVILILFALVLPCAFAAENTPLPFSGERKTVYGKALSMDSLQGKVVLVVNVASACGLTPQYAGLQKLQKSYEEKGFTVLAFPCNQFGGQEPGSSQQIAEFCDSNYGTSFPIVEKIEVNGEGADPLYKHLTGLDIKPAGAGPISWNFEKFLIDKDGKVIARFGPRISPDNKELISVLEAALN